MFNSNVSPGRTKNLETVAEVHFGCWDVVPVQDVVVSAIYIAR